MFARLLALFRKPVPTPTLNPTYQEVIADRDATLASGQFWVPSGIQFDVLFEEDERLAAEAEANDPQFECCDEGWF